MIQLSLHDKNVCKLKLDLWAENEFTTVKWRSYHEKTFFLAKFFTENCYIRHKDIWSKLITAEYPWNRNRKFTEIVSFIHSFQTSHLESELNQYYTLNRFKRQFSKKLKTSQKAKRSNVSKVIVRRIEKSVKQK